jgi:manganese/zinc/iron transport system permease protein
MSSGLVIILTGVLVAVACSLLGVFLVLRKMSMLADAISHAILPGLVAGYFVAQGPNLLAGFVGAAAAAIITVTLVEALEKSRRVRNDAAIGIVFPAMFALGTVIVSRFFANVHLDADAILFGNIEFAALESLFIGPLDLGPQALWVMGALCVINLLFVTLFYKELKLATFDPGLAGALGFSPVVIHYALMTVVSITAVGAFTAVGAVLTVALLIVPAATAYLLTHRLPVMIGLAAAIGAASALGGYALAVAVDASIAGAMATVAGLFFGLALVFSPAHGALARALRLRRQRAQFASETLVMHLATHENTANEHAESAVAHLSVELRWTPAFAQQTIERAVRSGLVTRSDDHLSLTESGRDLAESGLQRDQTRGDIGATHGVPLEL